MHISGPMLLSSTMVKHDTSLYLPSLLIVKKKSVSLVWANSVSGFGKCNTYLVRVNLPNAVQKRQGDHGGELVYRGAEHVH